jgi:hypothetical protein
MRYRYLRPTRIDYQCNNESKSIQFVSGDVTLELCGGEFRELVGISNIPIEWIVSIQLESNRKLIVMIF